MIFIAAVRYQINSWGYAFSGTEQFNQIERKKVMTSCILTCFCGLKWKENFHLLLIKFEKVDR